jgi:archaellum component FlaF (FlaF/FlaG flagellin family)
VEALKLGRGRQAHLGKKRLKAVRCRRGISNIIGEVLVLAIVIGLMTGVIVFYNGLVNPIQQDYKSTAQQAEDSLKERFLIEDVKFFAQGSVKELNVTIYNFGDISLNIATFYINGTMLSTGSLISSPPSNLIGVNLSGSFVWIYSWSSGGIYQVKVVTVRGTMVESAFSPS